MCLPDLYGQSLSPASDFQDKNFSPFWDSGVLWMLINPKIMSFLDSFGCRWSPKWGFPSLVSYVKVNCFDLKVLLDCMGRLHCPLFQLNIVSLGLLLTLLSGLFCVPCLCVCGGGGGRVLIFFYLIIFVRLRRIWVTWWVCVFQSCQMRESLVLGFFIYFLVLLLKLSFVVNCNYPWIIFHGMGFLISLLLVLWEV